MCPRPPDRGRVSRRPLLLIGFAGEAVERFLVPRGELRGAGLWRVRQRIEEVFIPWYSSYGIQQWMTAKVVAFKLLYTEGEPTPVLEVRGVTKTFPGVIANEDIDLTLREGEIHCPLGENGAGKSTLMKIVSGVYPADSGVFLLDGQEVNFQNPQEAYNAGIRIVHQELSLIPSLSLAENMYIHRFRRHSLRFVSRKDLRGSALKTLRQWGIDIDPAVKISSVSMGPTSEPTPFRSLLHHIGFIET